ncbi:pro-FMRFamide-related neuropeptide VF [Xiphias gladius]|uniref:pro-FMRFamide-related neuropeptide VF n=1 Tax=Xiphias gladius TaxID=8245 RepID=UPI001A9942DF|nr:pro-FMRFamide-related neuropeptide VF [Xiphias gladius]
MSPTTFVSALLMLGGLGGVEVSDLQVYGKSVHSDKALLSSENGRHTVREQPHQQTKHEIRRSLDLKSSNMHVTPTTSKISRPSIIKLYPSPTKPLHLHANMPMRSGRESNHDDDKKPNSTPNMPQRFGRSSDVIRMCAECSDVREAPTPVLLRRLGRDGLYWSLLWTLANEQFLNTGLHWAVDFDFTTGSEEVETEEKTFKG